MKYVYDNVEYDSETGLIYWSFNQRKPHGKRPSGKLCGSVDSNGYLQVRANGKIYQAHRLIWKMVYGYWPNQIDHKNREQLDNRLDNLRECNNRNNCINRSSTTNTPGVRKTRNGKKYRARIKINYKEVDLGTFDTEQEAIMAYKDKCREINEPVE